MTFPEARMDGREVVSAQGNDGKLWWFYVEDAQQWHSEAIHGGLLFHVGGRWILLNSLSLVLGTPARIIDDRAALEWLTCNGHAPPAELLRFAEPARLR